MKFGFDYAPQHLLIGGSDIGALTFNEMTRYEDANFNPMDRTNDVEFNREWGIDTLTAEDELLNQAHIDFSPSIKQNAILLSAEMSEGSRAGTDFSSGRYAGVRYSGSEIRVGFHL